MGKIIVMLGIVIIGLPVATMTEYSVLGLASSIPKEFWNEATAFEPSWGAKISQCILLTVSIASSIVIPLITWLLVRYAWTYGK